MKVTVRPADDGFDMRSNWVVTWRGNQSSHTKKTAAKRKAREVASKGDTLEIRRTDGTIQNTVTVTSSRESDDSNAQSTAPFPYGVETARTGISDFFNP